LLAAAMPVVSGGRTDRVAARDKADPDAEIKRFEGKWKAWRSEATAKTTADSGDGLLIEGNNIQFLWGGNNRGGTATFTVKPDANPKQIDLEHTKGQLIGKKQLGIYRFTGEGQLEISWAEPGVEKRPTKFSGKAVPGAGNPLTIYRSDKYKVPEAVAKELKALEGKWNLIEFHRFGRPEVNARGRREGVVIEDDDMQYLWGGTNKGGKARFVVDPSKSPKQIEIVYTVGQERYHKRIGIYRLNGNKLEISVSAYESETRPTAFSGVKGTRGAGDTYFLYEREKE
jgi:uncharacterized protein (TIGR03067 family)